MAKQPPPNPREKPEPPLSKDEQELLARIMKAKPSLTREEALRQIRLFY